jgi:hypothetical protein
MNEARALGWLLLVLVALVVAALSILFFINASDEPLNPEAYTALGTRFEAAFSFAGDGAFAHQPIEGSLRRLRARAAPAAAAASG